MTHITITPEPDRPCWHWKRQIDGEPTILEYGADSELEFCHERCRRDWVDKLPESSLIKERLRG